MVASVFNEVGRSDFCCVTANGSLGACVADNNREDSVRHEVGLVVLIQHHHLAAFGRE